MSRPKLKPCPNTECRDPGRVVMGSYQVYRVCCEGCGMEGPMALAEHGPATKAEAARLWNNLPREQTEGE